MLPTISSCPLGHQSFMPPAAPSGMDRAILATSRAAIAKRTSHQELATRPGTNSDSGHNLWVRPVASFGMPSDEYLVALAAAMAMFATGPPIATFRCTQCHRWLSLTGLHANGNNAFLTSKGIFVVYWKNLHCKTRAILPCMKPPYYTQKARLSRAP